RAGACTSTATGPSESPTRPASRWWGSRRRDALMLGLAALRDALRQAVSRRPGASPLRDGDEGAPARGAEPDANRSVMIVAGEASGDAHGARLCAAICAL